MAFITKWMDGKIRSLSVSDSAGNVCFFALLTKPGSWVFLQSVWKERKKEKEPN